MKKLLGIILAVALVMSMVTIVPGYAVATEYINVDWISCYDSTPELLAALAGAHAYGDFGTLVHGAMLGNLKAIAPTASILQFVGWYMPLKEMTDVGVRIDGGDVICDGYATYAQDLFDALAGFENSPYVMRIVANLPVLEGNHLVELVALFADETSKVIYQMYYTNDDDVALGKPAYCTLDTVPSGGGALVSNNGFWNPLFINDGTATLFTGAETPLGWYVSTTTEDMDARIYIDLEGVYKIDSIVLESMGFNNIAWPNTYSVKVSLDGLEWTTVGGESGTTANLFGKYAEYDLSKSEVTAQYVLVQVDKANLLNDGNGIYYAGLGEVEVFGTKIEDSDRRAPFAPLANYEVRTLASADPGGYSAWSGFSTLDADFEFSFRTDVSFNAIGFPGFWSSPATPVTFEFYQNEVLVHSFDYTTAGDGGIILDLGTTLPKGIYDVRMVINDTSVNAETGNMNCYVVLGYALGGILLNTDYCVFERGAVAFNLYTEETGGHGFVPFDYHEPEDRDFDSSKGDALSYDQILVNGTAAANGNDAVIALKQLVDGSDGSITSVGMYGWYGNAESPTVAFGYSIDGGDIVFGDFFSETGSDVTGLNANNRRFTITVDVSGLTKAEDHLIRVYAQLENGDVVTLNRFESGKDRDIYINYRAEALSGSNIDGLSIYNSYPNYTTANHAADISFTINEGESLYILGWAYRSYTNLDKIVYKIGDNYYDCTLDASYYRARADVAGVLGVNAAYLQNSGFGLDTAMLELVGIDELEAGTYDVTIVANFQDDNTMELKNFSLTIEGQGSGDMVFVETSPIVNFDGFNYVDELGGTVETGTAAPDLGQLKKVVDKGAMAIKAYGWVCPAKVLSDIGVQTDSGEITWGLMYEDANLNPALQGFGFANYANAMRFDTSRVSNPAILEGAGHVLKLIAKYADNTYEIFYAGAYMNDDTLIPEWAAENPSSANNVGLWLNQADSTAAAAFTANAAFDAVKIPIAWSSRIDNSQSVTFEFALYAFEYNVAYSLEKDPIATVTRNPEGDEAAGYTLEFDEQPAGEYVLLVKIVDLAAGAYTVLPVDGDPASALYVLNNAANATSFNFAVRTLYPEEFFGAVPEETEAPDGKAEVDLTDVEINPGEDVVIDVSEVEEVVEEVVIDNKVVDQIAQTLDENTKVEVKLTDSTVALDNTAVSAILELDADGDLSLIVKEVEEETLNDDQKDAVKDEDVATIISVTATIGTTAIHDLGGGSAEISIPFTIADGYTADDIKVAFISEDGTVEIIDAVYSEGVLTFSTTHFSTFVVFYATTPVTPPTGDTGMFATVVALCMAGALVAILAIRRKESDR